jgi:molecular chaperone GrpE
LLPILDDFQRAVENVPAAIEADSWFEGIILVKRKIDTILDGLKVQPIKALGRDFDPNFHEALAQIDADGVESGIVLEVLQIGYQLKDRVIRPALVNVAA